MIKRQDKSQKEIPVAPEVAKYKKKSDSKGQPRAKHKHQYETVCLHHNYSMTKPHDVHKWQIDYHSATKVCVICGRNSNERDDAYYIKEPGRNLWGNYFKTKLIPEAFQLEHWIVDDMREKFARREELFNESEES